MIREIRESAPAAACPDYAKAVTECEDRYMLITGAKKAIISTIR